MPGTVVIGATPGQAIRTLHLDLGLTATDLQVVLETTPRHIERWAKDLAYPQTKARYRLAELMAFHSHLSATFTAWEGARDWLRAPSRYLAGLTPLRRSGPDGRTAQERRSWH